MNKFLSFACKSKQITTNFGSSALIFLFFSYSSSQSLKPSRHFKAFYSPDYTVKVLLTLILSYNFAFSSVITTNIFDRNTRFLYIMTWWMHKKFYEKIVMQRDNTIAATRIIAINPAKYFFPFEFLKLIISFTSYLFLYYYTFERSKLCFLSYSYALSFLLFF